MREHEAVTVIGLGAMGSALAGAFLEGGHPTTVWNRSAGKGDALVARGAVRADTTKEAFDRNRLVVISLLDSAAVDEVLESAGDAARGRVIVNLTTGMPDQARKAAKWASDHEAQYLDGGILGDPAQVGTPGMRFYYSGDRDAFEAHEATLKVLGEDTTYHGEDAGLASVYYMALIGMSYEMWISYLHTLAFVRSQNIRPTDFAPAANSVLTPTLDLLSEFARAADEGDYPPIAGPLVTHAALMDDLVSSWRSGGADTGRLEYVKSLIDGHVGAGRGDEGFSSLIEQIKNYRKDEII